MSRLALDDRDIKILSVLSREGRISKTELARRVNLSATPCWERMKRLEEAGLIETRREGRCKFHHLNTLPLRQIASRWCTSGRRDQS